uniref:Uncharacterized protein n=1 Tax=Oryza glumipatula TaxID=40148 RepID=A0A0E0A477_9ORYZ
MVVALGPGRFYGSSLPRPRFFSGGDRVEPPVAVTDPLMAWAHEAHWSMGGLSSKRLRLQGRIEGSIDKLRRRARRDARKPAKARAAGIKPRSLAALGSDDDDDSSDEEEEVEAQKQQIVDEPSESESEEENEEEEEEEALATIAAAAKRKRARKLSDEFDRVATMQEGEAKKQKPAATSTPARTSPRRKAAAEAAPTPAPARASPRGKAAAEAATAAPARASPRRKAVARRTSPRMKH